jgi:hypothetical protein
MRLLENLRNAEQKSVNAVRRGMIRAREDWGDLERRIRQRMRIYPQKLKKNSLAARMETEFPPDVTAQGTPESIDGSVETEGRKPIVSIHGHDVTEGEFENPAA